MPPNPKPTYAQEEYQSLIYLTEISLFKPPISRLPISIPAKPILTTHTSNEDLLTKHRLAPPFPQKKKTSKQYAPRPSPLIHPKYFF